jgi:hypothetical protein
MNREIDFGNEGLMESVPMEFLLYLARQVVETLSMQRYTISTDISDASGKRKDLERFKLSTQRFKIESEMI